MKKKSGISVLVIALWLIVALSSQCLSSSEMEIAEIYRSRIEAKIANCNAKIRYIDSDSQELYQYGQLELQKAEFLRNAKESLIMEMIEREIPATDYRIQHFLNSRFYETVSY